MSMFRGLARMARARERRRTELLLESLPPEIQKDIGWRWSPNRRRPEMPVHAAWHSEMR